MTKNHKWISTLRLAESKRDITFHYSYVCKKGFEFAFDYCIDRSLDYDYIMLLDADTVLEPSYLEKLSCEFEKDPNLGIASGGIYYMDGDKLKYNNTLKDNPPGTGRIWRKKCFFETEGYLLEPSPDSLSNAKAKMAGWNIKKFAKIISVQKRKTGGIDGSWKRAKILGENDYYLDKNFILVLITFCLLQLSRPYYNGLFYLYGYIKSLINNPQKIQDMEIRYYYQHILIKEYIMNLKKYIFWRMN